MNDLVLKPVNPMKADRYFVFSHSLNEYVDVIVFDFGIVVNLEESFSFTLTAPEGGNYLLYTAANSAFRNGVTNHFEIFMSIESYNVSYDDGIKLGEGLNKDSDSFIQLVSILKSVAEVAL